MKDAVLLHELVAHAADAGPERVALTHDDSSLSYAELAAQVRSLAGGMLRLGLGRGERVAVYLEKRIEAVVASFGAAAAGAVFVPVNPVLKAEQVGYILRDCGVAILVTSPERASLLQATLALCPDLRHVVVTGDAAPAPGSPARHAWVELLDAPPAPGHRVIDLDVLAILYTSGSTGKPKGVVLSHRNMVAGAKSVANYLGNHRDDVLLAALPLSFDAGFSQLTTAFSVGARAVLLNYLLPRDVLTAIVRERVTGLTAVPPLWIQLAQLSWPASVNQHLRYFANTGGRMPLPTLKSLRAALPNAEPYLMYGLTEAFRATYLAPQEVERRPDSIGKAIPNAEILVLREDGTACAPNEEGELVQRGALVGLGYWGDPQKTAERYRPLPGREPGLVQPEIAVFSGDTVRMDDEGFLYFVGRRDEMIKTSGYRISPTEIEEVVHATGRVVECAAMGIAHPVLGQAIVLVVMLKEGEAGCGPDVLQSCRERLPAYMLPAHVEVRREPLPRNPNGKIDRKLLSAEFDGLFEAGR